MKKHIFILIIMVPILEGCLSQKKIRQSNIQDDPIRIAILDFSKTSRLYKKDSVFSVSFYDTIYSMVLVKQDNGDYHSVSDQIWRDMLAVSIGGASYYKFPYAGDMKFDSKAKLPTRFIEENGKLFYWWDSRYPLTEQLVAVFKKYDLLQDNLGGLLTIVDKRINDAAKGVDYYFCRNNLLRYKKVITNKAMGFYDIPSLNCDASQ